MEEIDKRKISLDKVILKTKLPEDIINIKRTLDKSIIEAAKTLGSYQNSFKILVPNISKELSELMQINKLALNSFVKEFSEVRNLININASSILREYKTLNQEINQSFSNNIFKELGRNLGDIQRNALQSFASVSDIYKNQMHENLRLLYENINTSPLKDIANQLSSLVKAYQDNYSSSFGMNIIDSIGAISADDRVENLEEVLQNIEEEIKQHYNAIPKNSAAFSNFLTIILFLLGILYSHYNSIGSEKTFLDAIEKSNKGLMNEINKLKSSLKNVSDTIYVVQRLTYLYSKPNRKSFVIDTLYPNNSLKLVARKNRWIYVEYFDFIDSIPKYGWIQKKYSKMFVK